MYNRVDGRYDLLIGVPRMLGGMLLRGLNVDQCIRVWMYRRCLLCDHPIFYRIMFVVMMMMMMKQQRVMRMKKKKLMVA